MEGGDDILQPGVNIMASVSVDKAVELVYDVYGFKVQKITELNGYDDRNYHIIVEKPERTDLNISKDGYVLKIINSLDSKNPQFFDAQNAVLLHLAKKGITCSKPIPTKNGQYSTNVKLPSGEHIVRLLEFISGCIFPKIKDTPRLYFQIGQHTAKLDNALQDFHHPAYDSRKTLWHLISVPKLRDFVFAVKDDARREMVLEIISEFESRVLQVLHTFEKGLIHGDVNEQNIIVEEKDEEWQVKAIIDFGDSHLAYYIFELGTAMTYMIVVSNGFDSGRYVVAGYSSVRKIPHHEFQLIRICILARLCQSLVLGAYSNLQNPENTYVIRTSINGWTLLEKMFQEEESELLRKWRPVSENEEIL